MNGKFTLYVDQYSNMFQASTCVELRKQIGSGGCNVTKMYADTPTGESKHVGYVIGGHWLTAYQPI